MEVSKNKLEILGFSNEKVSPPRTTAVTIRILNLAVAVHKATAMPATKLGLTGRGRVEVGAFADLVAFDPEVVADRATFEAPHQYPMGIPLVVVGGIVTIRDGEQTGRRGGRALRGQAFNSS